jgi:hypothetical protein
LWQEGDARGGTAGRTHRRRRHFAAEKVPARPSFSLSLFARSVSLPPHPSIHSALQPRILQLPAGCWELEPPEALPLSLSRPLAICLSASLPRARALSRSPSLSLSFSPFLPRAVLQMRLGVDGQARPLSLSRSVCLLRALSCARARTLSLSLLPSALCEKLSLYGTGPDFEPFRLSRLYGMGFRVRNGPLGAWVSVTLCPR